MFRSLVIIAEIAVLVTVLQSSFAQYLFEDFQATVSDWMLEISHIPEQQALQDFRQQIVTRFNNLRPFQQSYLDEVLASRASVNRFYQLYCEKGDKNPFIYGATLNHFCSSLTQTSLLDSR